MQKTLPKILFILFTIVLLRGECWGSEVDLSLEKETNIGSWGKLFETLLGSEDTLIVPIGGTNTWSVKLHQGTFDENWEDIHAFFTTLPEDDAHQPKGADKGPRAIFANEGLSIKPFSTIQRGALEGLMRNLLQEGELVYTDDKTSRSLMFKGDLEEETKKGPTVIKLALMEEENVKKSDPIKLPPNGLDVVHTAGFMMCCAKMGIDPSYLQVEQDTGETYKNGILTSETDHEVYIEAAAQAYMASLGSDSAEEKKQTLLAQAAYANFHKGTLPKGITNPVIVIGKGFMGVRDDSFETEASLEKEDVEVSLRLRKVLALAGTPNADAYVGAETGKVYIPNVEPSHIGLIQQASKLFMYGEGELNLEAQLKVFKGIQDLKVFFEKGTALPSSFQFSDLPEAFRQNPQVIKLKLEMTLNAMMEDLEVLRGDNAAEGDFVKALNTLQGSITLANAVEKAVELEDLVNVSITEQAKILESYKLISGQLKGSTDPEVKLESLKMFVQQLKEVRCMALMGSIQTCGPIYGGLSIFGRLNARGDYEAFQKHLSDSFNAGLDVVPLGMLDDPDYKPKENLVPILKLLPARADKALGKHKERVLAVRKSIKDLRQQFGTLGLEDIGAMIELMLVGFQRIKAEFPTAESIPKKLEPLAEQFKAKKAEFHALKEELEAENLIPKLKKAVDALNELSDYINFKNVKAAREFLGKPKVEEILSSFEGALVETEKSRQEVAEHLQTIKLGFDEMYREFIEFEYQAREKLQEK